MSTISSQSGATVASLSIEDVQVERKSHWRKDQEQAGPRMSVLIDATFNAEFQEAHTNEIRIEEQDPEALNRMLAWIYTGNFPLKEFYDPEMEYSPSKYKRFKYEEVTRLYRCAHFFLLPSLQAMCKRLLLFALRQLSVLIQQKFQDADALGHSNPCDENDLQSLMAGVAEAFNSPLDDIRELYLKLLPHCHFKVIQDETFTRLANDIPEFWGEVQECIILAAKEGKLVQFKYPRKCRGCGFMWPLEWSAVRATSYGILGVCDDCRPREFGEIVPDSEIPEPPMTT
ncbi:hypothetical protein F5Y16DRAFT_417843 [Xylariaceae sp. FL0255]|nr:hypothetical protein F5Y16DRAFT_417843 [Xylariaceae sp. FL0255]